MKRLVLILAAFAMLFAFNVAGCCFGEPDQGQICFIIIPIPGADSGTATADFTIERVDCASVK